MRRERTLVLAAKVPGFGYGLERIGIQGRRTAPLVESQKLFSVV